MRKILSILVLGGIIALMASPVLAVEPPKEITKCKMRHDLTGTGWSDLGIVCPGKSEECPLDSEKFTCGICCLLDTIYTVTDWLFVGIVLLVVIFVLLGAYNLLTAAGDSNKYNKGRDYILWAAIGMIAALLAKSIPAIAKALLALG